MAAGLVLAACGGGGADGSFVSIGVGSGGTGVSVSGPIRGFGSVIVNGVRFDDSNASITLDDDNGGLRSTDLRLGMMVDIEGKRDAGNLTGTATSITARSYVQGPVTAVDVQTGQLTVLGVTVSVTAGTVFDGGGVTGLTSLAAGENVEIHGIPDAAGKLRATRIERKAPTDQVRLSGTVQASNVAGFTVNGITVQTPPGALSDLPGGVTVGMLVRIKGTLANPNTNPNTIVASRVRRISLTPPLQEARALEVEGVVTAFTSASEFEVNGMKVRVAADAKREGGVVAPDVRIEVEGTVSNGILIASKVEVKDEARQKDDANELHARILAVDLANQTFTVRDRTITVKWNASTRFDDKGLPRGAAELDRRYGGASQGQHQRQPAAGFEDRAGVAGTGREYSRSRKGRGSIPGILRDVGKPQSLAGEGTIVPLQKGG